MKATKLRGSGALQAGCGFLGYQITRTEVAAFWRMMPKVGGTYLQAKSGLRPNMVLGGGFGRRGVMTHSSRPFAENRGISTWRAPTCCVIINDRWRAGARRHSAGAVGLLAGTRAPGHGDLHTFGFCPAP
jgi:hypothetical protein